MLSPLPAPDVDAFTWWTRVTSSATRAALFLCFAALLLDAVMARVDAATLIVVTTTSDSGPGSLRQAIADASNGDNIQFDSALDGQTISLTSAELAMDKDISVSGPGADLLTMSRYSGIFRIFHIMPGHTVTIQRLKITNGLVLKGAAS